MLQHGILQKGISFRWEDEPYSCGYCWPEEKIMGLSIPIVKAVHQNLVEEIILHEIAHAIDYTNQNRWRYKYVIKNGRRKRRYLIHDKVWRDIAKSIGLEYPTATIAVCTE